MTAPTIGVDVAEAEGAATGVGRYTTELVRRWIADPPATASRFVLFARRTDALPPELRQGVEVVAPDLDTGVVSFQQLHLPRLLRRRPVDLLFAPAYAVPLLSATPSVVAIHDLSFERDGDAFAPRERWRRRLLARASVRRARRVLTISEFSAAELRELYGLEGDAVVPVACGVDRETFRPPPAPRRSDPPTLLAVGTILRRRHLDVLVRAFARLPERFQRHHLVIVGADRARPPVRPLRLARELGVADRVRLVEAIDEDELVELYRGTDLFVCLSDYEGFGLPVAEAVAAGAPTLVLDQPVFRELWGDLLHTVDTATPDAVATAIEAGAGAAPDRTAVERLLRQRFDWDRAAAEVLDVLLGAAGTGSAGAAD